MGHEFEGGHNEITRAAQNGHLVVFKAVGIRLPEQIQAWASRVHPVDEVVFGGTRRRTRLASSAMNTEDAMSRQLTKKWERSGGRAAQKVTEMGRPLLVFDQAVVPLLRGGEAMQASWPTRTRSRAMAEAESNWGRTGWDLGLVGDDRGGGIY
jgi:hypothetical protein